MSAAPVGYLSPAVALRREGADTMAACAVCGYTLCKATVPWKAHAIRRETPLAAAGGAAWDTGFDGVFLRQFFCPSCATLLDTETATEGDPVLVDRLVDRR